MSRYQHSENTFTSTFRDPKEWEQHDFRQPGSNPMQSGQTEAPGAEVSQIRIRIYPDCILPDFGTDLAAESGEGSLVLPGSSGSDYDEMIWDAGDAEDDLRRGTDLKDRIGRMEREILRLMRRREVAREEGLYRVSVDWEERDLDIHELSSATLQAWIQTGGPILLMIHGTVGSVQVAFHDLFFGNPDSKGPIQGLIDSRYGGRILCFEHCTLTSSVEENADLFYQELLEALPAGGPHTLQIDLLTRSRGALVAREIMYREACQRSADQKHHQHTRQNPELERQIRELNQEKEGLQGRLGQTARKRIREIQEHVRQLESTRNTPPYLNSRQRIDLSTRTVVMIAPPNRGTMVSNNVYHKLGALRSVIFSLMFAFSILRIGQERYFRSVAQTLILLIRLSLRPRRDAEEVLEDIVPGMIDMMIGSRCITGLYEAEKQLASFYRDIRLMALAGDYNPQGEAGLITLIKNRIRDRLFGNKPNDLVVPTTEDKILHLGFRSGNESRVRMQLIPDGPPHTRYFNNEYIDTALGGAYHDTPLWQMLDRPDTTLAALNGGAHPPLT